MWSTGSQISVTAGSPYSATYSNIDASKSTHLIFT